MDKDENETQVRIDPLAKARQDLAEKRIKEDPRQNILFGLVLDELANLPTEERITRLGGIIESDTQKTAISPKRYADAESKRRLVDIIVSELDDKEVQEFMAKQEQEGIESEKRKKQQLYLRSARGIDLSLTAEELNRAIAAEALLKNTSREGTNFINPEAIRKYILESMFLGVPITFTFIRCLRFAYPNGLPYIIPDLEDYNYTDKDGNQRQRSASKVTSWFENITNFINQANQVGMRSTAQIIVADSDVTDVRSSLSPQLSNSQCFVQALREKYPYVQIITALEQEERDPSLATIYRDMFYSSAAYLLLLAGILNETDSQSIKARTRLAQYGLSPQAIQGIITRYETKVQTKKFLLPIQYFTFKRACEEERASQQRTLSENLCTYHFIQIYTALRIARDIAQIGVLLPRSGKNVIYVSDRSMKAVDFGFYGNKLFKEQKLPTLFQDYGE